jgi:hypothetical protein
LVPRCGNTAARRENKEKLEETAWIDGLGYGAPFLIECAHGDAQLAERVTPSVFWWRGKRDGGDGDGRTGEVVVPEGRETRGAGSSSQPEPALPPAVIVPGAVGLSGGSLAVGIVMRLMERWKTLEPNYGAQLWGADAATASLVSTREQPGPMSCTGCSGGVTYFACNLSLLIVTCQACFRSEKLRVFTYLTSIELN